ncbi:alpha-hydroxy acid oxidase [Orrella sp. 11846]|uniref:alpha-hydroxy acid oxidase n=1 Tax=Orrella sp. 11846 TaxID=3409913 RepID=UPI003B5C9B5B
MSTNTSAQQFLTLQEIVQKARQKLSIDNWDYIIGGTETETTVRRNRAALDAVGFKPRVLRHVGSIDTSQMFLGKKMRIPVMLAPVGSLELFEQTGAMAVAQAASQFNVAHMLSSISTVSHREIADHLPDAMRLFQLYVHGDSDWVDQCVEQVQQSNCQAFCLTVDSAYYSRRERDISKRNIRRSNVPGREHQCTLTWKDVDRIRSKLKIPLILKGIATDQDAIMAVEHGVDMVYISNHGGRQLDYDRGSLSVLPEVAAAIRGKATIIVDGGFCRGTDIVKAIAMGADMVGLGRMQCYGLAADGVAGVYRVLELLETEIRTAMGLMGVTTLAQLNESYLCQQPLLGQPDVLSAFPHLSLDESSFY